MHDFSCTNPDDMNYEALAKKARYFKQDEKGVAAMSKILEDMRKGVRNNKPCAFLRSKSSITRCKRSARMRRACPSEARVLGARVSQAKLYLNRIEKGLDYVSDSGIRTDCRT